MSGFSYKNLLLQIIHGSIIIVTIAFLNKDASQPIIIFLTSHESIAVVLFVFISFIIGNIIDFIADSLESFTMKFVKPPLYYILSKESTFGIALAHREYILTQLCITAAELKKSNLTKSNLTKSYLKIFKNKTLTKNDKIKLNYILQVAKNKAFKVCSDYQREQIDSFFVLYVFSRNISLSLLISIILLFGHINCFMLLLLFLLMLFSLCASCRYYLYYLRILLGSTIPKKILQQKIKN